MVGSRCRKVSFDPGKYIIQCLAQDAVEGKGDLVGVLNNRCFAIQNRNFGVDVYKRQVQYDTGVIKTVDKN